MFGTFFSSRARGSWIPEMDVYENDSTYRIIADLPEVKKDKVRVYSESKDTLCFAGDREPVVQVTNEWMRVIKERGAGRFERCIDFRDPFDPNKIKATFNSQTLDLIIPKQKAADKNGRVSDIKIE